MGEEVILFETDFWKVRLSPDQAYLGRCVVILKRGCPELSLVKKEEFEELLGIIKKLETTFKEKFNATMFNWTCLMNNAYKETNDEKPQVHIHFRPRYKDSVKIGDEEFIDKKFARHYDREEKRIVTDETLEEIKKKFHS